jgi:hypothetical protein
MYESLPEVLQFNISFIFVLLIVAVSAIAGYILYRKTNPDERTSVKIILGATRTIIIALLLLLFFRPTVFYRYVETTPQKIGLLIDNSASMALVTEKENRQDITQDIVQKLEEGLKEYDVEILKYYFNNSIQQDTVTKPLGPTNFEKTFNQLSDEHLNKIILLSDGIRTEGSIPSLNRGVPVYTVGIGNLQVEQDIFISDVEFKPIVYQGKKQSIVIKISSNNYNGKGAGVSLYADGKLINHENVTDISSGSQKDIVFDFTPLEAGLLKYKVEIVADGDDANLKNNQFIFSQDVVKSKIRIGIFSSLPDNELKFLRLIASQNDDFEIHTYLRILNKPVEKYFPVDSLDVLILLGYPGTQAPPEFEPIASSLRTNNPGLIIILNGQTDVRNLIRIKDFLPVETIQPKSNVSENPSSANNMNNALLRLYDNPEDNIGFINNVPPLKSFFTLKPKPETQIILESGNPPNPGIHILSLLKENRKSILVNGSGLWKWHFALQDNVKYKDGYRRLINNMIRLVTNKSAFKPVVLEVNKKSISPGQSLKLDGFLFNAQNNPVTDGRIIIEAKFDNQSFTLNTESDSTGRYSANYTPFAEGRYIFKARGFDNSGEIGTDQKIVDVLPYNREFIQTTQDSSFLKYIALQSAGEYYNYDKEEQLIVDLDLAALKSSKNEETELIFQAWLLYLIIALATTEWAFRKFKNLV